jgi:hypothetical protein
VKWKTKVKTYLATMLPRAVEIAAISRSHDCEWPVGRSSAGDEIRLRGRQKRVAGAKRQATGDKKIGVLEGRRGRKTRISAHAQMNNQLVECRNPGWMMHGSGQAGWVAVAGISRRAQSIRIIRSSYKGDHWNQLYRRNRKREGKRMKKKKRRGWVEREEGGPLKWKQINLWADEFKSENGRAGEQQRQQHSKQQALGV